MFYNLCYDSTLPGKEAPKAFIQGRVIFLETPFLGAYTDVMCISQCL